MPDSVPAHTEPSLCAATARISSSDKPLSVVKCPAVPSLSRFNPNPKVPAQSSPFVVVASEVIKLKDSKPAGIFTRSNLSPVLTNNPSLAYPAHTSPQPMRHIGGIESSAPKP